ncbi:amidohydrolase family protein [Microbacterium sp.]|uniref:amidohydrolase family protein n=1 Tax=Microbacterium sp. TaxID=51671 RepID=UPI003A8965FC
MSPAAPFVVRADRVLTGVGGEVITDGAVLIADGRVRAIGRRRDLPTGLPSADAGLLLMPGLIDAHTHLRGTPLSAQDIPTRPLESWLCSLTTATDLDPADDALVAAAHALESGITAVQAVVHGFDEAAGVVRRMRATAGAVTSAGLRALLILGFTDRAELTPDPAGGPWRDVPAVRHGVTATGFGDVAREVLGGDDDPDRLLRYGLGPVGPQWVGDVGLEVIAAAGRGHRRHTHLHESRSQRGWVAGEPSPLSRLARAGIIGADLSAAHGVDLHDAEIARLAAAGVGLVHCPRSNDDLAVGTARVAEWLRRGVRVGLGTDSARERPDIFDDMRDAIVAAERIGDPVSPEAVIAMATTGGADALGANGLGRIRVGGPADMIGLDVEVRGAGDAREAAGVIVERAARGHVSRVWVAGRQVVDAGVAMADTRAARERLAVTIRADETARAGRQRRLAPVLEAVDREIASVT